MADLVKIKKRFLNLDKVREIFFLDERIILSYDNIDREWVVVPDNEIGGYHKITKQEYQLMFQELQSMSHVII